LLPQLLALLFPSSLVRKLPLKQKPIPQWPMPKQTWKPLPKQPKKLLKQLLKLLLKRQMPLLQLQKKLLLKKHLLPSNQRPRHFHKCCEKIGRHRKVPPCLIRECELSN